MHIVIEDRASFVPKWNGNDKLSAEERGVFAYDALTVPVLKRVVSKTSVKFDYDRDGNPLGGSGEIDLDNEAPIRAVKNLVITNISYERGGKTVNVTNADSLLAAPAEFYGLIKEFAEHLREEAKKEAPEKN